MAKLVFGLSQSLDGYVDGVAGELELPPPGPMLFRHFYEWVRDLTGSVYGRRIYEVMRYWDEDQPEWDADERAFAEAWRNLIAVGARPMALTDNLNFGNPEKPQAMGELVGAIRGIGEAASALDSRSCRATCRSTTRRWASASRRRRRSAASGSSPT